jgi:Holliday junction resolvase RusA-like endonuclease
MFVVEGTPVPQGSAVGFVVKGPKGPRAVVAPANSNALKPWRKLVTKAAARAVEEYAEKHGAPWVPMNGPVEVSLTFKIQRTTKADEGRQYPTVPPDLDKLVRAVFDGMADAKVYANDSRVVRLWAEEEYGAPGVGVTVSLLHDNRSRS